MKKIVLASASPRRGELLKQIGLEFEIIPSQIKEETDHNMDACELVRLLSYDKAMNVVQRLKDRSLVIGADTVVVKNGILGKPENEDHAFDMISNLQGEWHEVITGITVIDSTTMKHVKCCEKTRVKMRPLTGSMIKAYIKTGEPMDKAGAYGIQGMGAILIEKIEGCYFNVVGLPLTRLTKVLEEFGITVL